MWDYLQIIPSRNAILAVTLITAKIKFMRYQFAGVGITSENAIHHIA